jgi:hypothetical protein
MDMGNWNTCLQFGARSGDTLDGGGDPPDDGSMEARVAKLEADLSAIKVDVAVIKTSGATKEDIAKLGMAIQGEINTQTWKLVTFVCGFGTALVAATFYIATHLK